MSEYDPPDQIQAVEVEPTPLTPVARQERIAAMDVLRGIAVFGIFLINMPLFIAPANAFFGWESNPLWTAERDRLATLSIYIFAQGKFYTMFSFLFGLGFGVQMIRAAERHSTNFTKVYLRRLTILLGIGALHMFLVWWGDVLHVYALLGFVLMLFRKRSDKTLIVWACCLTFIPLTLALGGTTYDYFTKKDTPQIVRDLDRVSGQQRQAKRINDETKTYGSGTFVEILKARYQYNLGHLPGEIGWSTELLTNFLLGLWCARRRVFSNPEQHLPMLRKIAYVIFPIALTWTAADQLYGYLHPGEPGPLWRAHAGLIREFLCRPGMTSGYIAILLLAGVKSWMAPFAAVGRMALTNYLLHSLTFTTVALGYGFGMYSRIPPATGLALCIGFYALQVPFSMWWLGRYPYGPAEWVWRRLTYGATPA
jgi:uncharacterized protein